MKKVWIIALIMATFAVSGLFAQDWWFITNREGGPRARDNTVTLRAGQTNYIYVMFRGERSEGVGAQFDRMRINFRMSAPAEVIWQCAYYPDMSGGVLGSEESTGVRSAGPIETNFASFTHVWSGPQVAGLDKSKMNGFCLAINVPRDAGNITFTMLDIEFIGLQQ